MGQVLPRRAPSSPCLDHSRKLVGDAVWPLQARGLRHVCAGWTLQPKCSRSVLHVTSPCRHVVRATRVTADEALDEQRMQLTVDQHGHILSVSAPTALQLAQLAAGAGGTAAPAAAAAPAGPKPHVFGFAPENLMGRKLHEAVDLFAEWHEEGKWVEHVGDMSSHLTCYIFLISEYISIVYIVPMHRG